jgi:hypothetical protein
MKQIKNIQEILYTKDIKSFVTNIKLNPYWISGFTAGEGSFIIKSNLEKSFGVVFSIGLTTSDQHILWTIREYFGGIGNVYSSHGNIAILTVSSKKDLRILIDFFDKYPILGNKALDYAGFREVAILIERKEQYTEKGYERCIELYINQNTGRNYHDASQRAMIIDNFKEYPNYGGINLSPNERALLFKSKNIVPKVSKGKIAPKELKYTAEKETFVNEVK